MSLHAFPIVDDLDVERLRFVRNATAWGYSNYNDVISEAEQRRWWAENHSKVLGWLYRDDYASLVGFGLLRLGDDGYWRTVVGVLPSFEGRGYGKAITHDIVVRAPGPCRATARKDNPAAVKLHVPEDWLTVDGPDERLVYFETRPGVTQQEPRPYQPWCYDPDVPVRTPAAVIASGADPGPREMWGE